MTNEILINCSPLEIRMALIERGVVQALSIEPVAQKSLVGSIYKGRVLRVLPGMQAAFIDIGLDRSAFIHVNEIIQSREISSDAITPTEKKTPDIQKLIAVGQSLVVQILKDPMGSKGARLTSFLSIPSHYLVFMPYSTHVGLAQRIDNPEERDRLKVLLQEILQETTPVNQCSGGVIARTSAEGVDKKDLLADLIFLKQQWAEINKKIIFSQPIAQLYQNLPLHLRSLRDFLRPPMRRILVDSAEHHQEMIDFAQAFMPSCVSLIERYEGEQPLFDLHHVEDELKRALHRKIFLKSGGYLIFDQTEAMTTIDVNTGAYVGHCQLEETIFKTNVEAAEIIARQIRLRNLGGIIIIDFIDMSQEENKKKLFNIFEQWIACDREKTKITQVSELGLVEMTRKRTQESLAHVLCEVCPVCQGKSMVKTAQTICGEIFRQIIRGARNENCSEYLIISTQSVVDYLLNNATVQLAELECCIGKKIRCQAESLYKPEQYEVVLLA